MKKHAPLPSVTPQIERAGRLVELWGHFSQVRERFMESEVPHAGDSPLLDELVEADYAFHDYVIALAKRLLLQEALLNANAFFSGEGAGGGYIAFCKDCAQSASGSQRTVRTSDGAEMISQVQVFGIPLAADRNLAQELSRNGFAQIIREAGLVPKDTKVVTIGLLGPTEAGILGLDAVNTWQISHQFRGGVADMPTPQDVRKSLPELSWVDDFAPDPKGLATAGGYILVAAYATIIPEDEAVGFIDGMDEDEENAWERVVANYTAESALAATVNPMIGLPNQLYEAAVDALGMHMSLTLSIGRMMDTPQQTLPELAEIVLVCDPNTPDEKPMEALLVGRFDDGSHFQTGMGASFMFMAEDLVEQFPCPAAIINPELFELWKRGEVSLGENGPELQPLPPVGRKLH